MVTDTNNGNRGSNTYNTPKWYIKGKDNKKFGKYTTQQMLDYFEQGKLNENSTIACTGMKTWAKLKDTELIQYLDIFDEDDFVEEDFSIAETSFNSTQSEEQKTNKDIANNTIEPNIDIAGALKFSQQFNKPTEFRDKPNTILLLGILSCLCCTGIPSIFALFKGIRYLKDGGRDVKAIIGTILGGITAFIILIACIYYPYGKSTEELVNKGKEALEQENTLTEDGISFLASDFNIKVKYANFEKEDNERGVDCIELPIKWINDFELQQTSDLPKLKTIGYIQKIEDDNSIKLFNDGDFLHIRLSSDSKVQPSQLKEKDILVVKGSFNNDSHYGEHDYFNDGHVLKIYRYNDTTNNNIEWMDSIFLEEAKNYLSYEEMHEKYGYKQTQEPEATKNTDISTEDDVVAPKTIPEIDEMSNEMIDSIENSSKLKGLAGLYTPQIVDKKGGGLKGQVILTYGRVYNEPKTEGYLQVSVPDTYHGIDCYLAKDSNCDLGKLHKDDTVLVAGTISGATDAFFFQQVQMADCYVFMKIGTAEYYKDYDMQTILETKTDSWFEDWCTESNIPYNEGISSDTDISSTKDSDTKIKDTIPVSSDNYDMEIGTKSYDDIVRNADSYKGTKVKFKGKISQVMNDSLLGFATSYWSLICEDSNGNKYRVAYKYMEGESHKMEGDSITVYGTLDGNSVGQTLLGSSVEVPCINADSIE